MVKRFEFFLISHIYHWRIKTRSVFKLQVKTQSSLIFLIFSVVANYRYRFKKNINKQEYQYIYHNIHEFITATTDD